MRSPDPIPAVPAAATGDGRVGVGCDVQGLEWDRYVRAHPAATRYHQWVWKRVFERAFGHETIYLVARRPSPEARRDGPSGPPDQPAQIVGVLPLVSFKSLLFGRFLVSLPFVNYGGILADDEAAATALLERARQEAASRRASHVELRHTRRMFPGLPAKQHKVAMTMPLPADEESAWKGFDNKLRNQIRKAQKSNLEPLVGGAEFLDDFYSVFARNMRDLGTPVYSKRLFVEVLAGVPEARAFSIRLNGAAVAAAITIGYRDAVENPWASSLREHRSLNPNMLLYWTMIRDAIVRKYRLFDFGRSTPGEGTYQFKKQWGAIDEPFFWEYVLSGSASPPDRSPASPKFRAAVAVWQRLPLALTKALGPAIVRNIP